MARSWTAFISISLIILFSHIFVQAQDTPAVPEPSPDSLLADTTAAIDSLNAADENSSGLDSLALMTEDSLTTGQIPGFADDDLSPYYDTYLIAKGYGDYLRYRTGIISLQHGSTGQAELITKSIMLPGLGAMYNGQPIFNQGVYMPFRSGLDLNILMFENVSDFEITPVEYLGLFQQGEALSLKSMFWAPDSNPSSITVSQGPYDYDRSAWRFSRRFRENISAAMVVSFKNSDGYYGAGADYEDFGVAATFAYRPQPATEFNYAFYQHKAKQGILQFDWLIQPLLRQNSDLDYHQFKGKHIYSENINFELNLLRQKNYSHLFNTSEGYHFQIRDDIWGGSAAANLKFNDHHLKFEAGGHRHYVKSKGWISARSVTMGVVIKDSLAINQHHHVSLTGRIKHNNIDDYSLAGTAAFSWILNDRLTFKLSSGRYDKLPDLYSLYYKHPPIEDPESDLISSYSFIPDKNLESTKALFIASEAGYKLSPALMISASISAEKVYDDYVPVTAQNETNWNTTQKNITYKRLTSTIELDYAITKFFKGNSGATWFAYDPQEHSPGIEFSPSLTAYSVGELKFKNILRDIDIAGTYQLRYVSARYYHGFVSLIHERYRYKEAVSLDGSINVRFGAFEFRLCEDNILDYLFGNQYNMWGNYAMPPGTVWFIFTWDFEN
jgi:hypothetical protein